MVALLVYACCVGARSSRQVERAWHVDVASRVVCAGLFPDHRRSVPGPQTIARFRSRQEQALKHPFSSSLRLCQRAGMAKIGLVALDGTKMAANASMQANRTKETIDQEVEKIFAEKAATDDAEDAKFGTERGGEPPATLRGREDCRRRRFAQAKALLDAELAEERAAHEARLAARAAREAARGKLLRGRKPKAPEEKAGHEEQKVDTTDPESKVMWTSNGYLQGYNAQAVANEEQVVLSAEVTDEQNDSHQLHPMIDAAAASLAEAEIAERPGKLLADAGYASEESFSALDEDDPDCYVATRNMESNPTRRTGRRGPLEKDATLVDKMGRKVSNKKGRAIYKRRQQIIEPIFGQIKHARGIRSFMRRGRAAAGSEWGLVCGAHNLLKLTQPSRPYRTVGRPVQPNGGRDHLLIEGGTPGLTATLAPSRQPGPRLTSRQLPAAP